MEFRRLTKNDLDSYFANRLRALKSSPTSFLTTYDEEIAQGNAHFEKTLSDISGDKVIFGAVENGEVVATIGLYKETRTRIDHRAGIWGMYVDENFRGRGLGAKLLDMAVEFAKNKMKVRQVGLCVNAKNENAIALYESRGFETWGVEPRALKWEGEFFDDLHMNLYF